jgi:hypothetical protein
MFNEIKSLYLGKLVLFLFLLFFSSVIIAQTSNWTNVKETNINVANANPTGVDIFTNRYGNHIIVQESNILKYYRMDVNGYSNLQVFPKTIEGSATVSPSISGDANNIYVVYGVGNQVRVKRSTDGGLNWSLWTPTFSLSTNVAELGLESVVSSGKIHVNYLESGVVRYRYRNLNENFWSGVKEVSDGETGNIPRITAYKNAQAQMDYVYFMYRKFNGVDYDCRWRRYNVTNDSWHTPIYTAPIANDEIDNFAGIRVDNLNVIIYYIWHESNPSWQYYFRWAILDIYNNWIDYGYADLSIENYRMYSTQTFDNKTHTVFYFERLGEENSDIGLWRSYMADTEYPTDQFYEYLLPQVNSIYHLNLSSSGNEVHVIWKDPFGSSGGNNLRYKFDDQIPIAPKNLTVSKSQNNHPLLSWLPNPEPDLNNYKIYRLNYCAGGWEYIAQTSNTSYEDQTLSYCTAIPPEQCENLCTFQYKITAVDLSYHESDPSYIVEARLVGGPPSKAGADDPDVNTVLEYSLDQNYPNPFNPTTTINYSIKSAGQVTLKIYDMLGTAVASLVNEMKEAGNYSVTFNASELPSGIYFYTLTSGNFMSTKKLILLK